MPKNEHGLWMCWHRRKQCIATCRHNPNDPDKKGKICEHCGKPLDEPNIRCRHKYSKNDYDILECPECGTDRHCRQVVENDGDACKFHGGSSRKGIAHPNFLHGGRSKYMPMTLIQDYEEFLNHPNKLQVEESLAMVRAIWWERVRDLDSLGSPVAWTKARKLWEMADNASKRGNRDAFARYFFDLGETLTKGEGQASTRDEIRRFIEQERKLVDTQRQIYVDMGEFMTRAMVLGTIDHILRVTKDELSDIEDAQERLYRIAEAVERIFGRVHSRKPAIGSGKAGDEQGNPFDGRDRVGSEVRRDKIWTESGPEEIPF